MLVAIVVVAVVAGYIAIALPTRKRRQEWKELTKKHGPPPIPPDLGT